MTINVFFVASSPLSSSTSFHVIIIVLVGPHDHFLSCLFGVRPALPSLEKEFVTELMLRSQATCPQTRERPHGPPGSQWYVDTVIAVTVATGTNNQS